MVHKLHDSWDIWLHKAKDSNWSESSYISVAKFDSVEQFWAYFNLFESKLFNDKMVFLMRHPIKPIWEDPSVANGGYWSFKVANANIMAVLQKIIVHIIIEKFATNNEHRIIGVSTSPKKGFHIIKIWNNNDRRGDHSNIDTSILDVSMSDVIYTPFRKK